MKNSSQRTTIQISEEMRKNLKIFASYRDISYEDTLEDFISFFSSIMPFKNERDFSIWFENNLDFFGFKRIIEKRRGFPDYLVEDTKGKNKNVELEFFGIDFIRHKHDPKKVDLIICVFSDTKEVNRIPVLSVIESTDLKIVERGRRVSLSLDTEILKKLDEHAMRLRTSRSEAINEILTKYIGERKTCVVLAGGDPKKQIVKGVGTYRPLIKLGGRTLIEDIISKCREAGFTNLIIIGFPELVGKLFKILGDGSKYGVDIVYVEEKKELGSAKTLELAKKYIETDFLFLPADFYIGFDLRKILEFHKMGPGIVTIGIHTSTTYDWDKGIVQMEGSKIIDYEENPKNPKTRLVGIFTGFMKPEIFDMIPNGNVHCSLQEDIFPKLSKEGKLIGYPVDGDWVNIHKKEDIEKAIELSKRQK